GGMSAVGEAAGETVGAFCAKARHSSVLAAKGSTAVAFRIDRRDRFIFLSPNDFQYLSTTPPCLIAAARTGQRRPFAGITDDPRINKHRGGVSARDGRADDR